MVVRSGEVRLSSMVLFARMIGGETEVWFQVGELRHTAAGPVVCWTPRAAHLEPAWKACLLEGSASASPRRIEFAAQTEGGFRPLGSCSLGASLQHALAEAQRKQRSGGLRGGGPRLATPRWWG